jgi:hypothetical protein
MRVIPEVPEGQLSKLKFPEDFSVACPTMPSPPSVTKRLNVTSSCNLFMERQKENENEGWQRSYKRMAC